MRKIKSLSETVRLAREFQEQGKTVALIVGCFDVLHIGHIELFKFAKERSDLVVVGLENDENVRLSKGKGRPVHKWKERAMVLSELSSVDFIFKIRDIFDFGSLVAKEVHKKILHRLKPNYIVTNPVADRFWKNKKRMIKEVGGCY